MPINPAFRRTDRKAERIASEIDYDLARTVIAGPKGQRWQLSRAAMCGRALLPHLR
jgi:hypothetical protein